MPHKDERSGEMEETLVVISMVFIANNESAKVVKPCKEALNFPASGIPPEGATILGGNLSVAAIGGDKLDSVILSHLTVQAIDRPLPEPSSAPPDGGVPRKRRGEVRRRLLDHPVPPVPKYE